MMRLALARSVCAFALSFTGCGAKNIALPGTPTAVVHFEAAPPYVMVSRAVDGTTAGFFDSEFRVGAGGRLATVGYTASFRTPCMPLVECPERSVEGECLVRFTAEASRRYLVSLAGAGPRPAIVAKDMDAPGRRPSGGECRVLTVRPDFDPSPTTPSGPSDHTIFYDRP